MAWIVNHALTNMNIMLTSIQEIKDRYDTYLVDMVGVMYDSITIFKDAVIAVNYLLAQGKQIIFLSNSPWPSSWTYNQLKKCNLMGTFYIVTSGDVMHYLLKHDLHAKKIYHLGRDRKHDLLQGTDVHITSCLDDADAIIVSCFIEAGEDPTIFDEDLKRIAQSTQPIYCPNPDRVTLNGKNLRFPSGYFAEKLRTMGATVTDLGKPSPIIYNFITTAYPDLYYEKEKTLMIGDTLETDIQGATFFGVDSLLVLSGTAGRRSQQDLQLSIQPTYSMPYLK